MLAVPRVHEEAALQQRAVDVRDERPDVAGAEASLGLQVRHQLLLLPGPARVVRLVDRVDLLGRVRNPHLRMAEEELADRGIQREAVHARAAGVHEHRGRAVHDVPGGDLPRARLKAVGQHAPLARAALAVDAEDRADGHVHVDVGGAVQRIEDHDVVAGIELLGDRDQILALLGGHARDSPVWSSALTTTWLAKASSFCTSSPWTFSSSVEPRMSTSPALFTSLEITFAASAMSLEQVGELSGRLRMQALLVDQEPGDRDHVALKHGGQSAPWRVGVNGDGGPARISRCTSRPDGPARRSFPPGRCGGCPRRSAPAVGSLAGTDARSGCAARPR